MGILKVGMSKNWSLQTRGLQEEQRGEVMEQGRKLAGLNQVDAEGVR